MYSVRNLSDEKLEDKFVELIKLVGRSSNKQGEVQVCVDHPLKAPYNILIGVLIVGKFVSSLKTIDLNFPCAGKHYVRFAIYFNTARRKY